MIYYTNCQLVVLCEGCTAAWLSTSNEQVAAKPKPYRQQCYN